MPLAKYLVKSRHGIYYLRIIVHGREKRRSLGTRDPKAAKLAAYQFGRAVLMSKFPDMDNVKGWTLKKGDIELSTDGTSEDHTRGMEALELVLKSIQLDQVPASRPPRTGNTITIQAASIQYMESRKGQIGLGTVRTWQSSFNKLNKLFGARLVRDVTSLEIAEALRAFGEQRSPKTVEKDAQTWKMFWEWLLVHAYADSNPVKVPSLGKGQRAKLNKKFGRERLTYSMEDLSKLFNPERLRQLERPEEVWLPLLACWTGARLESLCRLKTSDFDGATLHFDARSDKTGKSRVIPIHSALIRMGLLDFVADMRKIKSKEVYLFPHLSEIKGRRGHKYSMVFGTQRKNLGIHDKGKDFHSFRTTLVSHLQLNGCSPDSRRLYVGHEPNEKLDVHIKNYSKAAFTPEQVATLIWPFITLPEPDWKYEPGSAIGITTKLIGAKANRLIKKTIANSERERDKGIIK